LLKQEMTVAAMTTGRYVQIVRLQLQSNHHH